MRTIEEIDAEIADYAKAMQHTDDASLDAMEAHVNALLRERCEAMGLPEEEINEIMRESAAVDASIAGQFVDAVRLRILKRV